MLEFKNISKRFKDTVILNNINLEINKGELVVLVGPSGCGKTTTLKMINKLIKPTSGTILLDGKDIQQENTISLRRNIGYVIQQTGLFPHMSVGENIGLIPRLLKWSDKEVEDKVGEMLQLVGMDSEKYIDRYPSELSGGQQQRIGVARAFASNPEVILMDEPFSALDPITRNQLQDELYTLQQELKKTIVFVTHDMDEALKLGDRICIMKSGNILQFDTPENILKNPAEGFVKEFIGKNRIWNQPEFIKAKDIMITNVITTIESRTITQGREIMRQNQVDGLLIVSKDKHLLGMVTLKELAKESDGSIRLGNIMEKNMITSYLDDSIVDILTKIDKENIGFVPIIDEDNIIQGLVTRSSLISVLSTRFITEEKA